MASNTRKDYKLWAKATVGKLKVDLQKYEVTLNHEIQLMNQMTLFEKTARSADIDAQIASGRTQLKILAETLTTGAKLLSELQVEMEHD